MPTAIIQTQNSAMDSTSEIFSADQVSTCRSCSRARRGPRLTPRLALPADAAPSARAAAGREAASIGRAPAGGRVTAWVESIGSWAPVGVPVRPPAARPPPEGGTGGGGRAARRGPPAPRPALAAPPPGAGGARGG